MTRNDAAPYDQSPQIVLRGLTKRYGGTTAALAQIDLDIRRGEFLTLLGPSGSGKTTLLNLLAGIVLPDTGSIRVEGREIAHLPPENRGIGMVFQHYALFPHLSVRENVGFPLRIRGLSSQEITRRVNEVLAQVHLEAFADRHPAALSGGQQQRVAVARALVFSPTILLMDEPLSALDRKLRDAMKAELRELHARLGLTIIYVTHDQEEALALSSRIVLMRAGQIEQIGTAQEIYDRPVTRFAAEFVGDSNLIEGVVTHDAASGPRIETALGHMPLPQSLDHAPGGQVLILIRPEHLITDPAQLPQAAIVLDAKVTNAVYEGPTSQIEVSVSGQTLHIRRINTPGLPELRVSDHLRIGWRAGAMHLVNRDDG